LALEAGAELDPASSPRGVGAVLEQVRQHLSQEGLRAAYRAPVVEPLAQLDAVERVCRRGLHPPEQRLERHGLRVEARASLEAKELARERGHRAAAMLDDVEELPGGRLRCDGLGREQLSQGADGVDDSVRRVADLVRETGRERAERG